MMNFLSDLWIVLALVLAVLVGLLLWKVGPRNLLPYFKTKGGKGVLKGIILAPLVIVLLAVAVWFIPGNAKAQGLDTRYGSWLNDASVFMGIDRTKKISPQCAAGGYDDRSTSNMGLRLNIWQSPSKNVRFNTQYTHHSCALNPDRNSYDALGVQVEWLIWSRN